MIYSIHAVKNKAKAISPALIEMRRYFHQHPEIGLQEYNTAKVIAEKLQALGLNVTTGVGKTGVVALLKGKRPGKTIALRADMDALPIEEKNEVPYASLNRGFMHGCGHDGHVASLIGAAMILKDMEEELAGAVKFIFQPAEEGPGGAKRMIADGVLEGVDAIAGVHLWMDVPAGKIGVRYGGMMACLDDIDITIKGKGGHGSMPHQTVDAIVAASHVVCALQTIASRETSPVEPVVISIGTIHGGYAYNIIADEVTMKGTVRAMNPKVREALPAQIERTIAGVAAAMRAEYSYQYHFGYPPVINDQEMTSLLEQAAAEVVGPAKVMQLDNPTMGGEDMSYYLEKVPGSFAFVGIGNPDKGIIHPHHNARFDMDEDALAIAAEFLAVAAVEYLGK